MKYAALRQKLVDFDISRGNEYHIEWIALKDEQTALKHGISYPEDNIICYEDVIVKLAPR